MASKQVVDRQKSADSVIAIGETHADATHTVLVEIMKPFLKQGEPMPNFAAVMKLSCAALAAAKDHIVQKDEAHETELSDDTEAREARDEAVTALYDQLVQVREMVTGAYGGPTATKILSGATPQDPVMLARFAGEVASRLGAVKLPAPRIKGAKLDVAELADSIQSNRAKLEKHLKGVQREVREAQLTLDAKNEAIAGYDETFTAVASGLSGLLRLAGKIDLAARVRPSVRRPGQTAENAEDLVPPPDK